MEHYTYKDYAAWDTDERYELIDGIAYAMAAPLIAHQNVVLGLSSPLWSFLKGKLCQVFVAPFDVRLNYDEGDDTCVQPDVLIVCDSSKLSDGKNCKGAPDFVAEVLSPSTSSYDCITKLQAYQDAGVREYWIIDPEIQVVFVNILDADRRYVATVYKKQDTEKIPVHILPGCEILMADLF